MSQPSGAHVPEEPRLYVNTVRLNGNPSYLSADNPPECPVFRSSVRRAGVRQVSYPVCSAGELDYTRPSEHWFLSEARVRTRSAL